MNKFEILVPAKITTATKAGKTVAGVAAPIAQHDLMFMQSILVSTGENKNDDVFLPEDMWAARSTPAYKPVDWEHNTGRELTSEELANNPGKVVVDNQTIGVMYNTYVVDENGLILDNETLPENKNFHIVDEAVIWKGLYPGVASRIEEGAKNNTLFVSMEAWFSDYHYLLGNKIIARNEETAFLDKSLRANGGNGTYENSRVRRILKNIVFGGKGIVARPANEPSIITSVTHEPLSAKASLADVIQRNTINEIGKTKASVTEVSNMSDKTENQPAASLELAKAAEELNTLKGVAQAKEAELAKANEKASQLTIQVEKFTTLIATASKKIEETVPGFASRISEGNSDNFFSVLADMVKTDKVAFDEVQAKLKAALDKISKTEADAVLCAREIKLDQVLAKSMKDEAKKKAKKEKMMAALKTLDDASFASLLDALSEDVEAAVVAPIAPVIAPVADSKDPASAEAIAKLIGVSPELAASAALELSAPSKNDDAAELDSLLKNVKAAEAPLPAGNNIPQGVDIHKAYNGLVQAMLTSHKTNK